jgi:hypothetical protein
MLHTAKLIDLKPWEIIGLKRSLRYFTSHGIKVTYRKRTAYIHCDSTKPYQCIFNILYNYRNRLVCNPKAYKWLTDYYPFNLLK